MLDVTELASEPLLRLSSSFASHGWFEAACNVAHIWPRMLLESVAPQTLIAMARAGHGIAVVPSPVRIPRSGVRAAVLVHRGASIGRWAVAACGTRDASCHPTLRNLSKSWSPIAGAAIRAKNMLIAHHRYRGQDWQSTNRRAECPFWGQTLHGVRVISA